MRQLGKPKYITIHCAATAEGRDIKAETISQWDIERFNQVSYHYVIELDGTIKNTLSINVLGAHVARHNTNNIGICYIGGVDSNNIPKDTRTDAQKLSMGKLIKELSHTYGITDIKGHRDWPKVQKACPSFSVRDWLNSIKSEDTLSLVGKTIEVNTPNDTLNVRDAKAIGNVIGVLNDKDKATIIGIDLTWYKVKTDTIEGWINSKYVNIVKE